jgi:hypothetical protein
MYHDRSLARLRGLIASSLASLRGGEVAVSFQAYLDNIRAKTGETPEDFRALAKKAGVYSPDMKASGPIAWLKREFNFGHGHAMVIWKVFKDKGWVHDPPKK